MHFFGVSGRGPWEFCLSPSWRYGHEEEEVQAWLSFQCLFEDEPHGTEKQWPKPQKDFKCQGDTHILITVTCGQQVDTTVSTLLTI